LKTKLFFWFAISAILFGSFTIYRYFNESQSAIEKARVESDAQLLSSEAGITRYKVFGEQNSATVILIHSFNGFLESWNPNIDSLVKAGHRVVVYDLFGRGLSDRPHVKYDLALFRNQLDSVREEVGAEYVHLVGASFGCVIASDYALHHPEKIGSLVMLGPAGWPDAHGPNPLLDIPLVAEVAFHFFGRQILKPKVEAYLFNLPLHYEVVNEWERFARYPGFTRAALSTIKHSPVLNYTAGWKKLGELKKPTIFVWGREDKTFPFASTEKIPELIPHAKVVSIENAAHWVNVEQAQQVNSAIISFLSRG
jgi:pimeloyl-ACP methyl ester carboxylesterase